MSRSTDIGHAAGKSPAWHDLLSKLKLFGRIGLPVAFFFIHLHLEKDKAMKLVIMTLPTFFVEEDKILTALFDEGMDNLHLYKPGASPMYSERLLSLLPEETYGKITVHDHYYLKNEYGLAGIHIDDGTKDAPQGYKGKFSMTCTDISTLAAMKKKAEYVFLADTFMRGNGGHYDKTGAQARLAEAVSLGLIDKHVYAYGGVSIDNIKEAKELGFGGVVVCEDLCNKFDIHNEPDYKDLISHFGKLRKAIS